ncbi:MAG: hypothetical protein ABJN69_10895 [Hellea sp.]
MSTIIDASREAGAFKVVVCVLSGEAHLREENNKKVLAAAKALDFRVNPAARTLRSNDIKRLALLLG